MKRAANMNDIKVDATAIVWGCAIAIVAICKPIIFTSSGGFILPLAVIFGASSSTAVIWGKNKQKSLESSDNLQQLEQRIRDLETICTREELNFADKLEQSSKQ